MSVELNTRQPAGQRLDNLCYRHSRGGRGNRREPWENDKDLGLMKTWTLRWFRQRMHHKVHTSGRGEEWGNVHNTNDNATTRDQYPLSFFVC